MAVCFCLHRAADVVSRTESTAHTSESQLYRINEIPGSERQKSTSETVSEVVFDGRQATAAFVSNDRSCLCIGYEDGDVIVWSVMKKKVSQSFEGLSSEISDVFMSVDGKWAVSGPYDGTVRVWDANTGSQLGETMIGHTNYVRSVPMCENGKRVA